MILRNNKGVTLIELMIVMVIAAILVAGIYTLFTTQQRSYFVQDQVSGVQQDARVALDIMARDIRMAGFLTGAGSGTGFYGVSSIYGCNYAVVPANGGASGSDVITVVLAAEQVSTATVNGVSGQTVSLDGGVGGADGLNPGDYVAFEGEKQVYLIQSIDTPNTNDIQVNGNPPNHLGDNGAQAYRVQAITYNISGASLQRDGQPLAGDGATTVVEDLQFAYQVAGNTTTWYNTPTEASASNADIRMVRINITVRTAVEDATVADAEPAARFDQPALEDHTTGLNTDDGFRRRVYTTVVKLRNL